MKFVNDAAFRPYGRVLPLDTKEFCETLKKISVPAEGTVYEPSVREFEALPLFKELTDKTYGEMPTELGHCSGHNEKLNALEYHRSSEIDIAATDLVLMLGRQQDIDPETLTYDTGKVECFFVPAGTAVELYATTLHFAPCGIDGKEFRCGVALPRGTNEALENPIAKEGEDRLLFAVNKWMIAHEESGLQKDGAYIGLKGENLSL
ncbi:DUF4867 family protein [Mitsuokella sp.]|uniref:DUF4867 family protein n=1 Tax=Mitsuokella sp. TaxID=2049034 RepID=UPI003D7DEC64